MKQQLLLIQDVEALGKKGEIVSAKPGYVRNYLLPMGFAIVASPHTLRAQEKLRKEREQQAIVDRRESEELIAKIKSICLETSVKVDPEGHMYGSVSAQDVVDLFAAQGIVLERRYVLLNKPLKTTGSHTISLRLKEEMQTTIQLMILPEGMTKEAFQAAAAAAALARQKQKEVAAAAVEESKAPQEEGSLKADSSSAE